VLVAALLALVPATAGAHGGPLPPGFRDTVAIPGLNSPTVFRIAADGEVFVAQKGGKILVFENLQDKTPKVFADLRKQTYDYGDRGLLGLALDPDFPARPYVYALYTFDHVIGDDAPGAYPHWGSAASGYEGDESCIAASGGEVDACPVSGRLVRLTDENDAGVAEKTLVEGWCQQFSSHSIGDLNFGPEGALYASGGEGASFGEPDYGQLGAWPHANQCGDPPREGGSLRSQDLLTPFDPSDPTDPTGLSGTVIRVDPETGEGWPGNPLASSLDANERRIVAFGFRNPFRFAIDPVRGEAFVGNVGSDFYESIDRFPLSPSAPYNFGWPCFEGPEPMPGFESLELPLCEGLYEQPGAVTEPLYYYGHGESPVTPEDECSGENGSAIAGMAVYRRSAFPGLTNLFPAKYDGALFFADAVRGCIYVILADAQGELDPLTAQPFLDESSPYSGADIQVGPDGDLYYLSLYADEGLHRISYDPGAPTASLVADREWGPLDHNRFTVNLDATGSTDPDGEALEYAWDLDGDGEFEDESDDTTKTLTFEGAQNREIGLRVTDPTGAEGIDEITIYPGDSPPRIVIEKPEETLTWGVGQEIEFYGKAWPEGGAGTQLPASHLVWRTTLAHCPGGPDACHRHPLRTFAGVETGTLVAPSHDYPSFIDFELTATDSRGLAATETVRLQPRAVTLDLRSNPPGIALGIGNTTHATPFAMTAIEGTNVALSAPQQAQVGGNTYTFEGWSDGGARVHSVLVLASASGPYTAVYSGPPLPEEPGEEEPGVEESPTAPPATGGDASGRPGGSLDQVAAGPPAPPTISVHPRASTAATSARFVFAGTTAGLRYVCRLDRRPYTPCGSPLAYRRLRPGRHTFRVAVADADGAPASAAAVFSWRVLVPAPEPRLARNGPRF
jgi:glucose/arabinose dehydrogenase